MDDLNRKYANSYVYIGGKLAYVYCFDTDDENLVIVFMLAGGRKTTAKYSNITITDPVFPSVYYNVWAKGTPLPLAYVVKRRPVRQYRRGVCTDNHELCAASSYLDRFSPVRQAMYPSVDSFDTLSSIVSPWYPESVKEAITLAQQCGTVALCPELALMLNPVSDDASVVYLINKNQQAIGTLKGNNCIVGFLPALQEVSDCNRKYKWGMTIEGDGNQ